MCSQDRDDVSGNLILNREDIFQLAIIAFCPAVGTGGGINELARDADAIAGAADATFEHVTHTELAALWSPPWPQVRLAPHPRRSLLPGGEPNRPPMPAIDRIGPPPSDIRSPRSCLRHSRLRSALAGMRRSSAHRDRMFRCEGSRPMALPPAARAPQAAK
jgi:hypothetical protein